MTNAPQLPDQTELSVSEAADYFGLSKNAIRKRLQRGGNGEFRVDQGVFQTKKNADGEWRIIVESYNERVAGDVRHDLPQFDHDQVTSYENATSEEAALSLAEQNLAVFRDAFVMPLVDRIGELERELGRVEHENEHLKDQIQALEGGNGEQTLSDRRVTPDAEPPRWWQFWRYYH